MTLPTPRTLWLGSALISAVLLFCSAGAWLAARAAQRAQDERLAKLASHARTISDLMDSLPAWATAPRPTGTLAPEVSAALASAGLPASALSSLSAEPESSSSTSPSTSVQARTRRATLVLGAVTLPQLGTFLDRWHLRQPAWAVSAIDLAPEPGGEKVKAVTGGDLPLRAVLTLESVFLEGLRQRTDGQAPKRIGGHR